MEKDKGKSVEFEKWEEEVKEEGEEGFLGLNDLRVKKGEVGWLGIYCGDNVCFLIF